MGLLRPGHSGGGGVRLLQENRNMRAIGAPQSTNKVICLGRPQIPSGQAVLFFLVSWTASKPVRSESPIVEYRSAVFATATTDMKVFV